MNENTGLAVQVIENASLDDVRPGDHITWDDVEEEHGATCTLRRKGIAHHRDKWGDWETAEGGLLTEGEGEGITITIRRPVPVKQEPGR